MASLRSAAHGSHAGDLHAGNTHGALGGAQHPATVSSASDATYYARMASSLGDKERILEHLLPGSVADIGTGGGELALSLRERGWDVVGFDPDPRPVEGVVVHPLFADEITADLGPGASPPAGTTPASPAHSDAGGFDNIVACAVLHEVFSYGNRSGERGRFANLDATLRAFRAALRPGGRLVVRDGVKPVEAHASMTLHQWQDADVERYLRESPFSKGSTDASVALEHMSPGLWEGSGSSVMECAFTLTWGEAAFEREVQELYGVFTLAEYAEFVTARGFRLVSADAYVQPGYVENLEGIVTLDGFANGFPDTNALWVFDAV